MTTSIETVGKHFRWHSGTSEIEDVRSRTRRPDSDYAAKVDVYEDRVRWWSLEVARRLTENGASAGDYVALAIGLSYVEGVEQYRNGDGTPGQSKVRFRSGLARMFPDVVVQIADRLYGEVRCGLFHSGFTEGPTLVSYDRPRAIEVTDGYLYLNPAAFVRAAIDDFTGYVGGLRAANPEAALRINFEKLWDQRWNATEVARTD